MLTQKNFALAWSKVKLTRADINEDEHRITIPSPRLAARGFDVLRSIKLRDTLRPFFFAFSVAPWAMQPEGSDDERDATYPLADLAYAVVEGWEAKYDQITQFRRVYAYFKNHGR